VRKLVVVIEDEAYSVLTAGRLGTINKRCIVMARYTVLIPPTSTRCGIEPLLPKRLAISVPYVSSSPLQLISQRHYFTGPERSSLNSETFPSRLNRSIRTPPHPNRPLRPLTLRLPLPKSTRTLPNHQHHRTQSRFYRTHFRSFGSPRSL
jgi:hypothetical protein